MADVQLSSQGPVIKTAYEGQSNTNAFTDSEKTKLAGIATSATANPNALNNVSEDTSPTLGGNLDGDGNEINNFNATFRNLTGTTYTLLETDRGKVVTLSNASPITVTMPNSLPIGWSATVIQKGAGQVTFSPASGATLRNRSTHSKIAGQYGMVSLAVLENSNNASAVYYIGGDTAA